MLVFHRLTSLQTWGTLMPTSFVRLSADGLIARIQATKLSEKKFVGSISPRPFQRVQPISSYNMQQIEDIFLAQDERATYSDSPEDSADTVFCLLCQYTGIEVTRITNPVVQRRVSRTPPQLASTVSVKGDVDNEKQQ